MELKKYKLGDLCTFINGRAYLQPELQNSGKYKIVRVGNLSGGNNSWYYSDMELEPTKYCAKGDLLYAWACNFGPYIWKGDKTIYHYHIWKVINSEQIDKMYLYYLLKFMTNSFMGCVHGSTMLHITKENMESMEVRIHASIEEQRRIATILNKLDCKIELNCQINDNLEAMAKQLYDYWFVQFDFPNEEGKPYKSSGGAMVWNEKLKREIPQGWNDCKIKDFMRIFTGKKDVSKAVPGNYKFFSCAPEPISSNEYIYDGYAVLVSGNGSYTGRVGFYKGKFDLYQRTYACVLDEDEHNISFFYYTLRYLFQPIYSGGKHGSSIPYIVLGDLADFRFAFNETICTKFVDATKPMFDEQLLRQKEVEALTKLRDELLPLLMNGQASVNYHLSASFLSSFILYRDQYKLYNMKETVIQAVLDGMRVVLTEKQLELLTDVTRKALSECEITPKATEEEQRNKENAELLGAFISSKKVEGCSVKTIHYYESSIEKLIATINKNVCDIETNDIRCYLAEQQEQRGLSKVTIDNLRRIYSSFFSWLEDEDYITKSPVRRIHKVRTDALVKEVLTDENIEVLRDSCQEIRDVAMVDLLLSTGMRVGELVKINREDIDFHERQCVVFGKGNKEREVYFNARTKIHLKKYLEQRTDANPALFVSLRAPHTRLTISGVEVRLRQLGKKVNLNKVHPHKFRRTLATMAIDKGMPIEQVQKMLGHVKIDTTLHYAMVNQANVKMAHRKYIN